MRLSTVIVIDDETRCIKRKKCFWKSLLEASFDCRSKSCSRKLIGKLLLSRAVVLNLLWLAAHFTFK